MYLNKILPVFALVSLIAACSPGAENSTDEPSTTSLEAPAEGGTTDGGSVTNPAAAPVQEGTTFKIDGSTAKSGSSLTVNPAHGEPGHRCDIDVGAPLNSASTKPAPDAAPTNTAVKPATIGAPTISAPSAGTSGKLNPAHGEPGHKCEIAVGAPL